MISGKGTTDREEKESPFQVEEIYKASEQSLNGQREHFYFHCISEIFMNGKRRLVIEPRADFSIQVL